MAEIADAPSVAEVTAALTAPGQLFEMEEVVIRGIPTRTWKHAPPSLRAVLEGSRAHGGPTSSSTRTTTSSFDGHFRARRPPSPTGWSTTSACGQGDRVAIAMRNFPEWSVAFWAAASVGAVVVPLNAWWTGPELEYGLADSGSVVLVLPTPSGPSASATHLAEPAGLRARRSSPRPRRGHARRTARSRSRTSLGDGRPDAPSCPR